MFTKSGICCRSWRDKFTMKIFQCSSSKARRTKGRLYFIHTFRTCTWVFVQLPRSWSVPCDSALPCLGDANVQKRRFRGRCSGCFFGSTPSVSVGTLQGFATQSNLIRSRCGHSCGCAGPGRSDPPPGRLSHSTVCKGFVSSRNATRGLNIWCGFAVRQSTDLQLITWCGACVVAFVVSPHFLHERTPLARTDTSTIAEPQIVSGL